MMPVKTDFGMACPYCKRPVGMRRIGGGGDVCYEDPVFKQYFCNYGCDYVHTHDYDSMAWEWLKRIFA